MLDRGPATIRRNDQSQVDKGKLTPQALEKRMGLLDGRVSGRRPGRWPHRLGEALRREPRHAPRRRSGPALRRGRSGRRRGAGSHDYEPGRRDAIPSRVVAVVLASYRREKGIRRQKFTAEEVVQRLVIALVDEGARILDEGIALRASGIDVVYLAGFGVPRQDRPDWGP